MFEANTWILMPMNFSWCLASCWWWWYLNNSSDLKTIYKGKLLQTPEHWRSLVLLFYVSMYLPQSAMLLAAFFPIFYCFASSSHIHQSMNVVTEAS
jgi:hypothetical protein